MLEGIYESLITAKVRESLVREAGSLASETEPDPADQAHILARHVAELVLKFLQSERDPSRRVAAANEILAQLSPFDDVVPLPVKQLLSLITPAAPGQIARSHVRPAIPLSSAALLTNAHGEPNLGSEVRAELVSADEVDLLCAFVKWHGLRLLEEPLRQLQERGVQLRVISTTYMGATERRALDRLVQEFDAEVRIQYDNASTRLHAKAWLFRRNSGFDTAYVGSSNLSRAAMLDGVEWNVRLSRIATPDLIEKFIGTFDTYWNSPTFELYDPERDRDKLDDALAEASSGGRSPGRVTLSLSGLEVRPYPFQEEMLEKLTVEREVHDRHRNLVVAATGTGKTVVAALDYRSLCEGSQRPRLLFVAHRKEILEQSRRAYQEVLADPNFGEFYVDGARPERWEHVFASIQSLHAYGVSSIPADAFDIVVVDEFHHAEARTYRRLLDHLAPMELLGLTATPERADGADVRTFFDGRAAVELRLWDALSAELLTPFHYFGLADGTDLTGLDWKAGRYDADGLENLYTGNDVRLRIVLAQVRDKIANVFTMRALGFCVSVAHAQYMAKAFNQAGVPAVAVSGKSSSAERTDALRSLRAGEINIVFAVDLFNEGLDLPDIDTVLFLRPTESAAVFLQQLGRGLRRSANKAVLTVLDFVGHQRKEFRFDLRLRAITGVARGELKEQIERGFPYLPSGCQIVLDRQTQETVLANVKQQLALRRDQLVADLRALGDISLLDFVRKSGVELSAILGGTDRGWTRLRRSALLPTRDGSDAEETLLKRVRALAHVDDPIRAAAYRKLLADSSPSFDGLSPMEKSFAKMMLHSLYPTGNYGTEEEGLHALRADFASRDEFRAVIEIAADEARHITSPASGFINFPLQVHGRYSREEIVTATTSRVPGHFREGVLWSEDWQADIFFITLQKSEKGFSPSTMYRDYAISPTLFHWESQSTTSVTSKTGRRYLNHDSTGSKVLIFTREHKTYEFGTAPYIFLGTAHYVSHTGDRPIAITWKLDRPMPADVFRGATLAV